MTQNPAREIWQAVLGELQLQVTRPTYDTWLKKTTGVSLAESVISVEAPTPFAVGWLETRMYQLVLKTLGRVNHGIRDVRFLVAGVASTNTKSEHALMQHHSLEPTLSRPQFNGRFTFSTFVEGASNQLAVSAAKAVAEAPGQTYNPLFIYSGVGLGKTHLLQAIGHNCLQQGARVCYVTSEQFTNEFIHGIRTRTSHEFRSKYRASDVLLIDDIQFIGGKEQTQEGFFHTFNDLHLSNRQIVITSDRPPQSLSLLEDRLRSRFESGLIADIQAPPLETRIAILKNKAEQRSLYLEDTVVTYMAQNMPGNIRVLEGCLNRVAASSKIQSSPISLDMAEKAVAAIRNLERTKLVTPPELLSQVEQKFGVSHRVLIGHSRVKKMVRARQVATYLLREELGLGFSEIGRLLGGRDHSTIIHSVRRMETAIKSDPLLRQEVLNIIQW